MKKKSSLEFINNQIKSIKKGILPLAILAILISSCSDDDENFTPIELQQGKISADMGSPFSKSVYVDLSTGITTPVDITSWDLAFESNGENILINPGKKSSILNTQSTDFATVSNIAEDTYTNSYVFEQTDGNLSNTAIGDWRANGNSKNEVYILNLGTDTDGNPIGHKKMMILDFSQGASFQIKYADMDGSNEQTKTVSLSSKHNFTYFSLSTDDVVSVEPEKGKWDLLLSPISVRTGPPSAIVYRSSASAQTNSYDNVGVAVNDPWSSLEQNDDPASERNTKDISSSQYEQITKADYTSPSTKANAIGRSWLQILNPHRAGNFKVYDFMTFIVKDQEGKYFKLRFISYKDPNSGKNGSPQFEYLELQ